MVTPFDEDGALAADTAAELARWLCAHGSDALVLSGTTGEGSVLDDEESEELWRAVRAAVTVPLVMATGSNDTRHAIEMTRRATDAGADAVLVVTPYYSRPPQSGLYTHFRAVAESTPLPLLFYDIPIRTGRKIANETMIRLARDVPNIVGVKDAASDVVSTARLVAEAPGGFEVYCGEDLLALPSIAVGAVGIVSVASHWLGDHLSEMVATFAKGDTEGARRLNAKHFEDVAFQSSDPYPNPMPAKAVCRALGHPVGQARLPIGESPAELDELAAKLVTRISG